MTSITFVVTLLLQLCVTIRLDIFSISHSSLSVVGWLLCFLLASLHVVLGLNSRRVFVFASLAMLVFCMYVGLRILLTSGDNFTVGGILTSPRFGLIPLLIFGAGFALSLRNIRYGFFARSTSIRALALFTPLPLIAVCLSYIQAPVISENYQPITDFTIILFSAQILMLEAAWPGRKPAYVQIMFGASLTFCVAVIALIGSTGIVAFWVVAVALFYGSAFSFASGVQKFMWLIMMLLAVSILATLPFLREVIEASRLRPLLEGSLEVTSISSRVSLLGTFFEQFAVDPLFGNFSADKYIGLPEGSYVHSFILSVLTHTGVAGFVVFSIALVSIVVSRYGQLTSVDILAFRAAGVLMVLGTLYTFFTWPPVWFFIGFLCIRPVYESELLQ